VAVKSWRDHGIDLPGEIIPAADFDIHIIRRDQFVFLGLERTFFAPGAFYELRGSRTSSQLILG